MKTVKAQQITSAVKNLCIEADCYLPEDVQDIIKKSCDEENFPIAKDILKKLEENYRIASCEKMPICQDTGLACVFLEIGQDLHIEGNIKEAVD